MNAVGDGQQARLNSPAMGWRTRTHSTLDEQDRMLEFTILSRPIQI